MEKSFFRKLAPILSVLVLFAFGSVQSADRITVRVAGGSLWSDGGTVYLAPGPVTYILSFEAATDGIRGYQNGFRVYQVGGAFGSCAGGYVTGPEPWYDWHYIYPYSDGMGADTIGFVGYAQNTSGIPVGPPVDFLTITTEAIEEGRTLCIDSSWYSPGGEWLWTSTDNTSLYCGWDGPLCYEIRTHPEGIPEFTNVPSSTLIYDHCPLATYDFDVESNGPVTYSVQNGAGVIDPVTGVWSYQPQFNDIGKTYSVTVSATNSGGTASCSFNVAFSNDAPQAICGPMKLAPPGVTTYIQIEADDVDCDMGVFSIVTIDPYPGNPFTFSIDSQTGMLAFSPGYYDTTTGVFDFHIRYSDGLLYSTCIQEVRVSEVCCLRRGDLNQDGLVGVSDLTSLIGYFFRGGEAPACPDEADTNADTESTIADISYLVSFLFRGGPVPPACW